MTEIYRQILFRKMPKKSKKGAPEALTMNWQQNYDFLDNEKASTLYEY